MKLDHDQMQAAHTDAPHVLVLAGAGSGKTATLIAHARYLLGAGVAPDNLVLITFTKRGAAEMRRRMATPGVIVTTFHSLAARIIRERPTVPNVSPNFCIWSETDRLAALKRCAADHGIDLPKRDPFVALKREHGLAARLDDLKRECDALDFDDLEHWALKILEVHGDEYRQRWSHVLVDEWQDTSEIQMQILDEAWRPEHRFKVGDPRQGIYRWRGARLENILDLLDHDGVEVHHLRKNYRSTPQIVAAGNVIARCMQQPWAKTMTAVHDDGPLTTFAVHESPAEEADAVAFDIAEQIDGGSKPGDIAVLARTWAALAPIRTALSDLEISWTLGRGVSGESIWQKPSARWLRHALRFSHWAHDDWALEEMLRGASPLGPSRTEAAIRWGRKAASEQSDCLIYMLQGELKTYARAIKDAVFSAWSDVGAAVDELHGQEIRTPLDDDPALVRAVKDWADEQSDESRPTAQDFLDWLALIELDEAALANPDPNAVVLSTVHGAKGEEYENVHLVGVTDGIWPNGRTSKDPGAMAEDRRLFYVACTRAEQRLGINCAENRWAGPKMVPTKRSRYLDEVFDLIAKEDLGSLIPIINGG